MGGFCKSCGNWSRSHVLRSVGWCSAKKDMIESINTCELHDPRPRSCKERLGEIFGVFWERSGAPIYDAATYSRKTTEMMIIFILMALAFAVMIFKVFPELKNAFLNGYMPKFNIP